MSTMKGLINVIDDPPIRCGFLAIWSESDVFGICVKFVS